MTEQNGASARVSLMPAWIVGGVFVAVILLFALVFGIGREGRTIEQRQAASSIVPQDPDQLNYPSPNRTIEDMYTPGMEPPAAAAGTEG